MEVARGKWELLLFNTTRFASGRLLRKSQGLLQQPQPQQPPPPPTGVLLGLPPPPPQPHEAAPCATSSAHAEEESMLARAFVSCFHLCSIRSG